LTFLLVSTSEEIECDLERMCCIFNKSVFLSRNPDSGQSTRALIVPTGDSPTPPGAMNLLLRGRPEIAIYPYNPPAFSQVFIEARAKG